MADRSTLRYWVGRFAVGLAILIAAGLGVVPRVLNLRDPIGMATLFLGMVGFYVAYTAVGPMTRLASFRSRTRKEWGEAGMHEYLRHKTITKTSKGTAFSWPYASE